MSNQSPVRRLTAEGRILAGFLTEDSAATLPQFNEAPTSLQDALRQKFSKSGIHETGEIVAPASFRHVDEPEAMAVLAGVALQCGGPIGLNNLVGFEWVQIAGILSGHYLAAPMPVADRVPRANGSISEIARFCLFGSRVQPEDLMATPSLEMISPERLRLQPISLGLAADGLTLKYAVDQEPSPIMVLLVDDHAIAVRYQERLVALLEAGVKEALCLISYGYGIEVLTTLPTVDPLWFASPRPPCIGDFLNEEVLVRIPVRTPRTMLRFSHQAIDLALPN